MRTCACSVANNSGGKGIRHRIRDDARKIFKGYSLHYTSVSFSSCAASSPFSSPLMTSCLLVSFLLRLDRASGEASSLQLGGSCSNSRRRGSISSSCGEGLVGECPGPSATKPGTSKLRDRKSGRMTDLDYLLQCNSSMTQVAIKG